MGRVLGTILVTIVFCLAGCVQQGPQISTFNGEKLDENSFAPLFTLESMEGDLWSLEEQRGKTVVLAFTYTRCYETCPVVSAAIHYTKSKLTEEENNSVVWVSVTIDPHHDSPSILENWTADRGYEWAHLTGNPESVNPVLDAFDVDPINFEDNSTEGYGYAHTQPTYIIDDRGYFRVVWTEPDWPTDLFLEDLRQII